LRANSRAPGDSWRLAGPSFDELIQRATGAGIPVRKTDHGFCVSMYLASPDGLRELEFTVDAPDAEKIAAMTKMPRLRNLTKRLAETPPLCPYRAISTASSRLYYVRRSILSALDNSSDRPFSFSASFNTAAQWTSRQCGHASTFALACLMIVAWAVTGPVFRFSDTWQLVINTGTTIVTFLMVFLIQNTQNRDTTALHLKLDELIRVSESARNRLLDLEGLTEAELERLKGSFTKLAGDAPDSAKLHGATEDLDVAGAEIQEAKEKVAAVADGKARKPLR
jgi:low affinity Fe/Cu permease